MNDNWKVISSDSHKPTVMQFLYSLRVVKTCDVSWNIEKIQMKDEKLIDIEDE